MNGERKDEEGWGDQSCEEEWEQGRSGEREEEWDTESARMKAEGERRRMANAVVPSCISDQEACKKPWYNCCAHQLIFWVRKYFMPAPAIS